MSTNPISNIAADPTRALDRSASTRGTSAAASAQDGSAAGKGLPQDAVGGKALANAVSQLNDYVQNLQRDLRFTLDESSGRVVVQVIDSRSKEIIRQIPPKEALQLAQNLARVEAGTILKAEA